VLVLLAYLFLFFSNCKKDDSTVVENLTKTTNQNSNEDVQNDKSQTDTDVTLNLVANDLELHQMQEMAKPEYLEMIIDPSFGTTMFYVVQIGVALTMENQ